MNARADAADGRDRWQRRYAAARKRDADFTTLSGLEVDPVYGPPEGAVVPGFERIGLDGAEPFALLLLRDVEEELDDHGAIVGCYLLDLPDRENLSMASAVLRVSPGRRRAGIGTVLLRHCEDRARLAGRTRLTGEAWDGSAGFVSEAS